MPPLSQERAFHREMLGITSRTSSEEVYGLQTVEAGIQYDGESYRRQNPTIHKTPFEAWHGEKPDLSHLRVLGCDAFVHVPKEKRVKLDSHTEKGQLVGYRGMNQWKVWIPEREEVVVSRDVVFDEMKGKELMQPQILDLIEVLPGPPSAPTTTISPSSFMLTPPATLHSPTPSPARTPPDPSLANSDEESELSADEQPSGPRESSRPTKGQPPKRYSAMITRVMTLDNKEEPITYQQAINHPYHGKEWEIAAQEEYDSLMKNETWEVVPGHTNSNVITSRWVFRHKKDQTGKIVRFKAWIVAPGLSQIYGVDYLETYAPVAKLVSIRVLFAIVASLDLEIHQMDVVSAFLASKVEEKIYREFPDGFKNGDKVGLLGKSIYGLKQSARYFNRRFHDHLLRLGLVKTIADPCVYVNVNTGIIIAIWVDDISFIR